MSLARCVNAGKAFVWAVIVSTIATVGLAAGGEEAATTKPVVVLDRSSYWRVLYSWGMPVVRTEEGTDVINPVEYGVCKTCRASERHIETFPAPGWTDTAFDDSSWCRRPFYGEFISGEVDARAGSGLASNRLRQLSLRGKFTVTDPAAVRGLTLRLHYRGGAVVYVNGREVARQFLPAGALKPGEPAEPYPREAVLHPDGKIVHWYTDHELAEKSVYPLRVRKLEDLAIPADVLRQGTNVLAIEIHAAAHLPECLDRRAGATWSTAGFLDASLRAGGGEGIVANVVRPGGLQVWNTNLLEIVRTADYGDPHDRLRPIELAGARNGSYTGRVVVSCDQAIQGLKATVSELAGPSGPLPASAARVRYGTFSPGAAGLGHIVYPGFKTLEAEEAAVVSAPAEAPVVRAGMHSSILRAREEAGLPAPADGAVQPVWLTVRIPRSAAPGEYRGTLTIQADGHDPVAAAVRLRVIDWTVPDPKDFATFMGVVQCPEAVAGQYRLPFGSPGHWRRVGESFDLIAALGGDVLVIPLTAESQYGNARSMVLWTAGENGAYTLDFSQVEKYVDVALAHMGRPRFVVVGVWDSCGRRAEVARREHPRISVRDPATGEIANLDGPPHGTEQSVAFWRPVLTGVRAILRKRGLEETMVLGCGGDILPGADVVEAFHAIAPDVGWQATRHFASPATGLKRQDGTVGVLYETNILYAWSSHAPSCQRVQGWRTEPSRVWMPRPLNDTSPLPMVRVACEQMLLAGRPGQGQVGADFWPVQDEKGRLGRTFYGRYPETHEGNASMSMTSLLWPGPEGPAPTLRYEIIRENLQECEARIFLEKLLSAEPCMLPPELAGRCQELLDERTRWHRLSQVAAEASFSFAFSGWQRRSAELYAAAAEAARAIGGQ